MNEVIIQKKTGGLGRRNPSGDMISGLLMNDVAVAGGVQLGTVYRLKSLQDALDLLIDAGYDTTHQVLVYEHIKEFFRVNPSGDLYVMLVAQSVAYADMLDKTQQHAKRLLLAAEGKIKRLGVAYHPTTAVENFTATTAAIAKAQALATEEYAQHRPVQIHLEGKGFSTSDTTNFRGLNAKNVSVVVGQSLSVAGSHARHAKYAAIGTELV